MMGRGADGGCVPEGIKKLEIDIFTQALKALALNHPFDLDDGVGAGLDSAGPSQPLGRYPGAGDGRRKIKKIQGRGHDGGLSGAKIGSSTKSRDGKFSKLWVEMEEYFRSVTAEDVMALAPNTQIDISNIAEVSDPCLLIPPCGIYGSGPQQDGVTQNLSNGANLQVMDMKQTEHCGADVKQDSKHPASGQAVDGCVLKDVAEGRDWAGADGDRAVSMSSNQGTSSGLIIPMRGICQNVSTSRLPNRESVSGPYLTEIFSMNQDLNLSSPKLGMNNDTNMAGVSLPVHELSSCAKPEEAVDPNWEASSSAELPPVASPEDESFSGEKPPAIALYDRQDSSFGAKSVMGTSNQKESNSIAKISLSSSTQLERGFGAKRKLLAASLRRKKRKLSDLTAEVITAVISSPENGEEELCHVCYGGDSEDWNRILFCDTCEVAVHQECYGVQKIPDGQWLCSWCSYRYRSKRKSSGRDGNDSISHKQSNSRVADNARPCILCPRSGGALKPVCRVGSERENNGCLQFAHLFCCQWVPETYIENTETMEPIKNTEGIKEARWKLVCSLCKEKHGACIQCSHGMCATAFHPLCARDFKLQMGISSKEGSDDVDMWAFCSKHSLTRVGRVSLLTNGITDGLSEAEGMPSGENFISHIPDEVCLEQENELSPKVSTCQPKCMEISSKGITNQAMPDRGDLLENCEEAMPDKGDLLERCEGFNIKVSKVDNTVHSCCAGKGLLSGNSEKMPYGDRKNIKTGDLEGVSSAVGYSAVLERGNSENSASIPSSKSKAKTLAVEVDGDFDCIEILRKAVHKRQFILTDVANQMGVSSNLLTSFIKGDKHAVPIDLQKKISGWLCNFLSSQSTSSQPATELDTFLSTKAYHQDDLARDFVQTGRPSKRIKNKKKILKAAGCSKGERTLSEMESSLHSIRAENVVGTGEKCYRHSECYYNETHLGLQNVNNSDQNKSFMKVDDAESTDEIKARQGQNNCKLVLKDFDKERQEQDAQQQAGPMTTEPKHNLKGYSTEAEDVPAGIGNSAVEKHSNSKHASFKVQAMKVSDHMELAQSGNTETDCTDISLKGCSTGEELDELMERYTAGSNLVGDQAEHCNEDGVPIETSMKCGKEAPEYYVHPYIQRRLLKLQKGLVHSKGDQRTYCTEKPGDGVTKENCICGVPDAKQETAASFILSNTEMISKDSQWKQLSEARNTEVIDMAPKDELEGEILFLQNNLLENARANHSRSENLILRVIMNFSEEQQALWKQRCDALLVNDYLNQAREAKKQGRKERRHKEAQAILAAATAAVAASPRISSSRKDGIGDAIEEHSLRQVSFPSKRSHLDDWNNVKPTFSGIFSTSQSMKVSQQKHLKGNITAGRPSSSSQTMLRAKETISRPLVAKVPLERHFDCYQVSSSSPREESLLCDICRLPESTRSNKICVCNYCRVAVHQDCYGILRNSFGGWYCQPCETLNWQYELQGMRRPTVASHGMPGCGVNCALCGGLSGAFKRTTDGRWVHVFCAEWMLENTFRRGQMELVEGLEILFRERYMLPCSICHRQGACLKCNFGHCQSTFHPLCARDSGFYMSVSTHGGRVQHKAYCEKHSAEQKLKAEARRCGGTEELKTIKQMRVELERLRLICERIIRREKLKRELLHCSHNILASKRDCVAFSAVFHSSFLPPDEYAVESLGSGQLRDVLPSQSEASHLTSTMDDILHGRINVDSCVLVGESGRARRPLAYSASSGGDDDRDDAHRRPRNSRKHAETLQREVVMTPTEANMQNRRLPKGYAYVPVNCLTKGKTIHQDVGPQDT